MSVRDKVIIITGGGQGIGAVYSHRLAEEGNKIVIAGINEMKGQAVAEDIKSKGCEALFIKTDVADEQNTEAMARTTVNKYGRIDVLINNAAKFADLGQKPFSEIPVKEWDDVMAVNLRGMWLCCKAVVPYMREQRKGKIINVSSSAPNIGRPFYIHYITSKAGIVGFTRGLAREVGEWNINVNCIAPGGISTEIERKSFTPEHQKEAMNRQCMKRPPVPEEMIGTIMYLASEDSDYLTGQTIHVNGGGYLY